MTNTPRSRGWNKALFRRARRGDVRRLYRRIRMFPLARPGIHLTHEGFDPGAKARREFSAPGRLRPAYAIRAAAILANPYPFRIGDPLSREVRYGLGANAPRSDPRPRRRRGRHLLHRRAADVGSRTRSRRSAGQGRPAPPRARRQSLHADFGRVPRRLLPDLQLRTGAAPRDHPHARQRRPSDGDHPRSRRDRLRQRGFPDASGAAGARLLPKGLGQLRNEVRRPGAARAGGEGLPRRRGQARNRTRLHQQPERQVPRSDGRRSRPSAGWGCRCRTAATA